HRAHRLEDLARLRLRHRRLGRGRRGGGRGRGPRGGGGGRGGGGAGGGAGGAGGGGAAAASSTGGCAPPDSTNPRMSFFVTRPPRPVPETWLTSTPCSEAMRATTGETNVFSPAPSPSATGAGASGGAAGGGSVL